MSQEAVSAILADQKFSTLLMQLEHFEKIVDEGDQIMWAKDEPSKM
jgi:hypothetical protein